LSGYLLDTNVVSMLSPTRVVSVEFLEWLRRKDETDEVFLSAVTIHEIRRDIDPLEHKGATTKAAKLEVWLSGLLSIYADKILAFDALAAAFSGSLEAAAISAGNNPGMADAAIAGIAKARALTIITRNTRDFEPFGVSIASPDDAGALG
jgi:predicted nucleic acid-binding protein